MLQQNMLIIIYSPNLPSINGSRQRNLFNEQLTVTQFDMLTETQYKVLMILLDDKGHPGWELAETLGMEESNLNPLLKRLEKKNFIFQGPPRKSNRPKKSEIVKKREGDYKEFPYFLKKELNILGSIIKEMVVTNKCYDIGFPYRIIRASNYMRSMRFMRFVDNSFDEFMYDLSRELDIQGFHAFRTFVKPDRIETPSDKLLEELYSLCFTEKFPPSHDKPVSIETLYKLNTWWFKYNLRRCLNKDSVTITNPQDFLDILWDYAPEKDINQMILAAIEKLRSD